jgi:hypothetical protein
MLGWMRMLPNIMASLSPPMVMNIYRDALSAWKSVPLLHKIHDQPRHISR